jgi:hypothetical protein
MSTVTARKYTPTKHARLATDPHHKANLGLASLNPASQKPDAATSANAPYPPGVSVNKNRQQRRI